MNNNNIIHIFTSYFGNLNFIKSNGFLPIAICRFLPKNYDGVVYQNLAPSKELLLKVKEDGDWAYYKDKFYAELLMKDLHQLPEDLRNIAKENNNYNLVLCCYEDPSKNCHRHIVADFFNEWGILGGNVHELTGKDVVLNSVALF